MVDLIGAIPIREGRQTMAKKSIESGAGDAMPDAASPASDERIKAIEGEAGDAMPDAAPSANNELLAVEEWLKAMIAKSPKLAERYRRNDAGGERIKAIAEAHLRNKNRDAWDFGFPDREEIWGDVPPIGYSSWARKPFWSTEECAALALGKEPSQISGMDIYQLYQTACFGSSLEHVREEILEGQENEELPPDRIRPVEFIAWAKEKKIRIPDKLEEAVLDNEAEVALRPNNDEGKSMEKSSTEVEERPVTGPADYRKWARAPYWSAEECVALLFKKEPVAGKGLPCGYLILDTHLMDRFHSEILSAQRNKELPERIRPVEFIDWSKQHKWSVPDELERAISMHYIDIANLQDRCEQLEQRYLALSRKNQELQYELDRRRAAADAAPKPPKEVTPRERSSLLRMVIAMAMAKYGYEPHKTKHGGRGYCG
jgi:hypothetical protein